MSAIVLQIASGAFLIVCILGLLAIGAMWVAGKMMQSWADFLSSLFTFK